MHKTNEKGEIGSLVVAGSLLQGEEVGSCSPFQRTEKVDEVPQSRARLIRLL